MFQTTRKSMPKLQNSVDSESQSAASSLFIIYCLGSRPYLGWSPFCNVKITNSRLLDVPSDYFTRFPNIYHVAIQRNLWTACFIWISHVFLKSPTMKIVKTKVLRPATSAPRAGPAAISPGAAGVERWVKWAALGQRVPTNCCRPPGNPPWNAGWWLVYFMGYLCFFDNIITNHSNPLYNYWV